MKNSLGSPARGEAFYPRNNEVKAIYRVLKSETSIYLAAPRRVGKTSILRHLEEKPEEGYYFVYVITESIDDTNEFFKILYESIIASKAIEQIKKVAAKLMGKAKALVEIIEEAGSIKFRESKEIDYHKRLIDLFTHLNKEIGRLVVMIDEFPQTIQNILDKSGVGEARTFLQKNRELRLSDNVLGKVNFIYTGSVSLFPMVEKVMDLNVINDPKTVDVPPLEPNEAKIFINLLMEEETRKLNDETLNYIVKKIKWLIPFHLQLIQVEILEILEAGKKETEEVVDEAFDKIANVRNKPQFDPYFTRLKRIFKSNEYDFVMEILMHIASNDTIEENVLNDLKTKYEILDMKIIIGILESDGYIVKEKNVYRYVSPILQLWCKKHFC